jgi:hypothetical protein
MTAAATRKSRRLVPMISGTPVRAIALDRILRQRIAIGWAFEPAAVRHDPVFNECIADRSSPFTVVVNWPHIMSR